MPYTTKTESVLSESQVTVEYTSNGSQVVETASSTAIVPRSSFERVGSNDPRNLPLLEYMKLVRPKRVRFHIVKKIVGYKFIYKRVYYTRSIKKRITTKVYVYFYELRPIKRKSDGHLVMRWVKRYKIVRKYRYYTQLKLRFRKVAVRVPVKVRVRVPVIIPGSSKVGPLQVPDRVFLLPNYLTVLSKEIRLLPSAVSQHAVLNGPNGMKIKSWSTGIGYQNHIINGSVFDFSIYPSTLNNHVPPYDDIYLSSTALHGLYKKVTNDLPSSFTSLAELPETIKAVLTVFKDGIKLFKRLKHLDAAGVYSALNTLSKARKDSLSGLSSKIWLQWYLAIAPTVDDIAQHLSLLSREERVWRKYSKQAKTETYATDGTVQEGYYHSIKSTATFKYSVIVEGRVTIDEYRRRAADSGTLTSALYAIVPLSFVADWAVDLSTYLESASVFEGLSYTPWETSSIKNEIFQKSTGLWAQTQDFGPLELVPFDHSYRLHDDQFRVDRSPLSSLPEMPLIPWKRNLVDQTVLNRSLTSLALLRVIGSKKN